MAALASLAPCAPLHAAVGGGNSLNGWAVFGGISVVLILGLFIQSTRRRVS